MIKNISILASILFCLGCSSSSIDGFIYTKMSFAEQIIGYLEAIVWIFLFITVLCCFYKFEKKILDITMIIVFVLICLMSIAGYLEALQVFEVPEH
jgi:hypothetical protein